MRGMFEYSLRVLEEQLVPLEIEYYRIIEASGFTEDKLEEAEPEIISALTIIQQMMQDLQEATTILLDRKKFYLAHEREL